MIKFWKLRLNCKTINWTIWAAALATLLVTKFSFNRRLSARHWDLPCCSSSGPRLAVPRLTSCPGHAGGRWCPHMVPTRHIFRPMWWHECLGSWGWCRRRRPGRRARLWWSPVAHVVVLHVHLGLLDGFLEQLVVWQFALQVGLKHVHGLLHHRWVHRLLMGGWCWHPGNIAQTKSAHTAMHPTAKPVGSFDGAVVILDHGQTFLDRGSRGSASCIRDKSSGGANFSSALDLLILLDAIELAAEVVDGSHCRWGQSAHWITSLSIGKAGKFTMPINTHFDKLTSCMRAVLWSLLVWNRMIKLIQVKGQWMQFQDINMLVKMNMTPLHDSAGWQTNWITRLICEKFDQIQNKMSFLDKAAHEYPSLKSITMPTPWRPRKSMPIKIGTNIVASNHDSWNSGGLGKAKALKLRSDPENCELRETSQSARFHFPDPYLNSKAVYHDWAPWLLCDPPSANTETNARRWLGARLTPWRRCRACPRMAAKWMLPGKPLMAHRWHSKLWEGTPKGTSTHVVMLKLQGVELDPIGIDRGGSRTLRERLTLTLRWPHGVIVHHVETLVVSTLELAFALGHDIVIVWGVPHRWRIPKFGFWLTFPLWWHSIWAFPSHVSRVTTNKTTRAWVWALAFSTRHHSSKTSIFAWGRSCLLSLLPCEASFSR